MIGAMMDITQRLELEEELRQAQKMEAVGRLAGGVAHDFNNLLTIITGRTHLVLGRLKADDPVRRSVEVIQKTADRAAGLTRQLLAFSRKQVLQRKVLDLNAMVADVSTMLRRLIGEDVELLLTPGPGAGRVNADPAQLEQALMNLAVNARDAMPGGGTLGLETDHVRLGAAPPDRPEALPPGPYAVLRVMDTGTGMDAATQARIFEPFFTTKEPGKGTGLGLSMVHGIVRQHGGAIHVRSVVGGGTTFEIYLPQVETAADTGAADDAGGAAARDRPGDHPAGGGRGRRARARARGAGAAGLHGAGGERRRPGRRGLREGRRADRPHPHRRGDAAHERPRDGGSRAGDPARHARAVHVGLHRRRHRPPRRARREPAAARQAVHARRPDRQGPRSPRPPQ